MDEICPGTRGSDHESTNDYSTGDLHAGECDLPGEQAADDTEHDEEDNPQSHGLRNAVADPIAGDDERNGDDRHENHRGIHSLFGVINGHGKRPLSGMGPADAE